jgi:hypothetical protein
VVLKRQHERKKTKNESKASGSTVPAGSTSGFEKATQKRKKTKKDPKTTGSAMEANNVMV